MHKHSNVVHIFRHVVARGVLADRVSLVNLAAHWMMDVDTRQLDSTHVVRVSPAAFHVARTYFSHSWQAKYLCTTCLDA